MLTKMATDTFSLVLTLIEESIQSELNFEKVEATPARSSLELNLPSARCNGTLHVCSRSFSILGRTVHTCVREH